MIVQSWSGLVKVLINIKPTLLKPGKKTIDNIIAWATPFRLKMKGINQAEINWIQAWIAALSIRYTGESKNDLLRCVKFLGWVNSTIPANEITKKMYCVAYDYYWWRSSCHTTPEPAAPPLPPPKPPPKPPTPPEFLAELEWYNDVLFWYTDQTGISIAKSASEIQHYWDGVLGNQYPWASWVAMQDAMSLYLNISFGKITRNFEWIQAWIGDVTKLEGKSLVTSILEVEGGGSAKTDALVSGILGELGLAYNSTTFDVYPQANRLTDKLNKIVGQWEAAGQELTGISETEIAQFLMTTYDFTPFTIGDIKRRLDLIEQEIGITTEQVSGEIKRPIDEEIKPLQYFIPASQAWVITALQKAGNIIFDAIQSVTGDLAKAINYIINHVVDISDEWLERLKQRLGDVGGAYDLESDPVFQEVAATAAAAETVITELPSWWVEVLAGRLQGYFSGGIGEKGDKGDPGQPGAQGIQGIPGVKGEPGEPGEGVGMAIEDIDSQLKDRLTYTESIIATDLTQVVDYTIDGIGSINTKISTDVQPMIDFLTIDMQDTLTGIAEAFETPEALIAFLLDVPEGEIDVTYDLWQILIAQIMERGLE